MNRFVLDNIGRTVVAAALMTWPLTGVAQHERALRAVHRLDSVLTVKYWRADVDSVFITRPKTKWTLAGRFNISGAVVRNEGVHDGIPFESRLTADYKKTLSVGANYMGLSLNLALNPAKLLGRYSDFEINVNSYGNRWGFDFIYQNAHNFNGWYDFEGQGRRDLPSDVFKLKTLNVNAYYAFNGRRFSYPAAFSQNYIQRRSAGSFLLAMSGQAQEGASSGSADMYYHVTNLAVGGGYGYNYVPARRWLLHLSALPTIIVYSHATLTTDDVRVPLHYHFPEIIFTGRAAVVRQLGHHFTGLSLVLNITNVGYHDNLAIYNSKWRARAFYGIRF